MPFVVWNFLELYSKFTKDGEPFDLLKIVEYDPNVVLPLGVVTDNIAFLPGDDDFQFDTTWMSSLGRSVH